MLARASLLILAAMLAACGVRGAPSVPPPLFGEASAPPRVPQPFQRDGMAAYDSVFAASIDGVLDIEDEGEPDFPETLDDPIFGDELFPFGE